MQKTKKSNLGKVVAAVAILMTLLGIGIPLALSMQNLNEPHNPLQVNYTGPKTIRQTTEEETTTITQD